MSNINFLIEDEIRLGVLSFVMIAKKFKTTYNHVNMVWEVMCQNEFSVE